MVTFALTPGIAFNVGALIDCLSVGFCLKYYLSICLNFSKPILSILEIKEIGRTARGFGFFGGSSLIYLK